MNPSIKIAALILLSSHAVTAKSFDIGSGDSGDVSTPTLPESGPIANDDTATAMPNTEFSAITGNVTDNDANGITASLSSSAVGEYGYIIFNADGSYTYTVDQNSPAVIALAARQVVTEKFSYTYSNSEGQSTSAQLIIQIIGNPVDTDGNTVFEQPEDKPFDNVDIEFNNRSAQATPVNPGHNIRGHLYNSSDKDWYKITTNGNEIVTLDMCPQGSTCFDKKSWVMYVFDSSLITQDMEEKTFTFSRWLDETGSDVDFAGDSIISPFAGSSNHMYLSYNAGFFNDALIGIVDPCFGTLNSVQIGVPNYNLDANGNTGAGDALNQTHDYFVAVSSPLKRSGEGCSNGDVVLEQAGRSALGHEAPTITPATETSPALITPGKTKTYTTTEQYISAFPNSDDQYTINVDIIKKNDVSIPPLMPSDAQLALFSATSRSLTIPQLRIADKLYAADLTQQAESRSTNSPLTFSIDSVDTLDPETLAAAYQGTYNPENQQVMLPRVVVSETGEAFSVILQYHPESDASAAWLEVIQASAIQ